jgi:hypothetical protein
VQCFDEIAKTTAETCRNQGVRLHTKLKQKNMEFRQFDFYEVRVRVRATDAEMLSEIERDFRFFYRAKTSPDSIALPQPHIDLECRLEAPPTDLPELSSGWISPRCTVYQTAGEKWISYYNGSALLRWNQTTETGTLWSLKTELLHELAYLTVLSRVGEHWDRRGLHRLHAAALSWDHQALLLVLPSGGGKTTFALSAIENTGLRLLSDDMPVIDAKGHILAFPNRIGCSEEPKLAIARNFVRVFLRQEHGVKWLIDTEAFAGRIAPRALPGWIFVGARKLTGEPVIRPISKWQGWKELFRSGVVGYGLPQVVELFLNSGWTDTWAKLKIVFSRSRAMLRLLFQSKVLRFELGPDRDENLACFIRYLDEQTLVEAMQAVPGPTSGPAPAPGAV